MDMHRKAEFQTVGQHLTLVLCQICHAELSMFGGRLFVSAAFSLLWVFTPSHYPTHVRGLGLGISNACGRWARALLATAQQRQVATDASRYRGFSSTRKPHQRMDVHLNVSVRSPG
jgi:hypothetical protein